MIQFTQFATSSKPELSLAGQTGQHSYFILSTGFRPYNLVHKLQTTDYRPDTSDYRLQTTDYRPQTTDYRVHTTVHRPQTSDNRLQTKDYRPQTTDYKPQISDTKLFEKYNKIISYLPISLLYYKL